jgi:type I restriction enzyme R subunit
MNDRHKEVAFEAAIEDHLVSRGGYGRANAAAFDRKRALDPHILLTFIHETQAKEVAYLQNILEEKTDETLLDELVKALDSDHEGCLKVLRQGFKCYGKLFRVAYFAPASGLNPDTRKLYESNRLTVTRQLRYSDKHHNTLDLVLSLNGLPLVSAELKNPLTGQTWRDAVRQYETDRDPGDLIFRFKRRTLVHFAVDTDEVYMTTRLSGKSTRFLPFNRGEGTGAGNPDNPDGYKTAYLWQEVWQWESLLDIMARFLHLQVEEKTAGGRTVKRETMIFPRYHQLTAVRKMVAAARQRGAGHNYLIQHSTGSGKSNTIAWFAHRLASLYNDRDEKVFDSVVVVTDRLVLDQQLQNTVYQFDHKLGVVHKIDKDSGQLAGALAAAAPIIITTLQKFPYVTEKIGDLPERKYAVIIDEAHSSQGGESAAELKGVLAEAAIKREAEAMAEGEEIPDYQEQILRTMARRGRQPNIGFFAFTATPKYKTLEVFGQRGPDGKPQPFHLYSMRQAIEEGFILDVLRHYTTYKSYFRLIKAIQDDPQLDKKKAARALARFMSLHPHNIAQKTEVMVEHFRLNTRSKIGGKAKAMVVSSSRLHAVRYKQAFDRYLAEKGYDDIKTLVAFSGTVADPDVPDREYTEVAMNNGIKERELPGKFASADAYRILIVAEKFQTGFDQPLLHTMYVDKRLLGIHAVQTLSRLNRAHPPLKTDTFILDFVNETADIQAAFQPYYESTMVGEEVEPRHLYELQARLEGFRVFYPAQVEAFSKIFYQPRKADLSATDHAQLNACIDPAVGRFKQLERADGEEFRKVLIAYRNLYAFLSQIIPFHDSDLETLYAFVRFLLYKLPKRDLGPEYRFDEEVALKYYRLEKLRENAAVKLQEGEVVEIDGPTSVGTGQVREEEKIHLSKLVDILNERFGTAFKPGDQFFFDSVKEDAAADERLRQVAAANTFENFFYVFKKSFLDFIIGRMDSNEDTTSKLINEEPLREVACNHIARDVYDRIRAKA